MGGLEVRQRGGREVGVGSVGDGREAGVVVLAGFYLADGERRDGWVQGIVLMIIVGCDGVEAWVDVGGDQSE